MCDENADEEEQSTELDFFEEAAEDEEGIFVTDDGFSNWSNWTGNCEINNVEPRMR